MNVQELLQAFFLVLQELYSFGADLLRWTIDGLKDHPERITALSTFCLVVITAIYTAFLYYQISLGNKNKKEELDREIADKICGPLLITLYDLKTLAKHFEKTGADRALTVDWPWEMIKHKNPYLSLQIPEVLYDRFEAFTKDFEIYEKLRPAMLFSAWQLLISSFKLSQESVKVLFCSKDGVLVDLKPAEFFVFYNIELGDYGDQLKGRLRMKGDMEVQILVDGVESKHTDAAQFDQFIADVRGRLLKLPDTDMFLKLQNNIVRTASGLVSDIENLLEMN